MTIYKIHFTNLIFFAIIQNLTKDYPINSQKTREIIQNVITKLLVRSHSLSLNPTREAFSVTKIGRFTNIPSVASKSSFSSSDIAVSFLESSISLYKMPLVIKNFFKSKPLFCQRERKVSLSGNSPPHKKTCTSSRHAGFPFSKI